MSALTDFITDLLQNTFHSGPGVLSATPSKFINAMVELSGGSKPIGAAGGDLGGTYPAPGVIGLQGHAISNAVPVAGEVLTFSGGQWQGIAPSGAFHPGYTSGRYYTGFQLGGNTLATFGSDALRFCPIYIGHNVTVQNLAVEIRSAAAGVTLRTGIYANNNGLPGALLLDAGTISAAATGIIPVATNIALTAGWYWLAIAPSANVSITAMAVQDQSPWIGQQTANFNFEDSIKVVGNFNAALPNPAGAIAYENNYGLPVIAWMPL